MIATAIVYLLILIALGGYSVLLLAITAPRAYRNGYAQGAAEERQVRLDRAPRLPRGNVQVLPVQRYRA